MSGTSLAHFPVALICAAISMAFCQLFKTVFYSIRDRKIGLHYLSTTGGFPSSHSAFVTALTVSVGIRTGFSTDLFAVSAVMSVIVMYDAVRLRREVQRHAKLLNQIIHTYHPEERQKLNEMVGHTPLQVIAGILTGAATGAVLTMWVF